MLEAMLPYLGKLLYGNPQACTGWAWISRSAIDRSLRFMWPPWSARNPRPSSSPGGTEANNLAIKGLAGKLPRGTSPSGH